MASSLAASQQPSTSGLIFASSVRLLPPNNYHRNSTPNNRSSKINIVCKYFRLGSCRFGSNCKYLHETSNNEGILPSPVSSRSLNINDPNKWVLAPEFVPNKFLNNNSNNSNVDEEHPIYTTSTNSEPQHIKSYAEVLNSNNPNASVSSPAVQGLEENPTGAVLCPYLMKSGVCRYESCVYDHGELCEYCDKYCLDPFNEEQRKQHLAECVAQHERQMEIAFAVQQSKEKTCGICFDIVWEKEGRETRFGILPNCNHCFCLECIRKWRQAKQFDNKIIRSCPECRTCSDFVCPSSFWVDSPTEKEELISKYKKALAEKDCKYFKKGTGRCPFGNKCFYKHAINGQVVDVGEPPRPERRFNSLGNIERIQNLIFWDYFEDRVQIIGDDLYLSDSDDSFFSEILEYF